MSIFYYLKNIFCAISSMNIEIYNGNALKMMMFYSVRHPNSKIIEKQNPIARARFA